MLVVGYRALVDIHYPESLSQELEGWFFVPARTSAAVVVALALWLLYRRSRRLLALPRARGFSSIALACSLALPGIALAGWSRFVAAPALLAPSLALTGLALAALFRGGAGVRAAWLPAVFLVFAVPLPAPVLNAVAFRLQLWTADYAGWILDLLGATVFVSGDLIIRPQDNFIVIENCSGMRSVETLTMLAVLMLDLFRRRGLHALALLVMAPLLGFALNGVRVVGLILNPHSDVVAIHNLQGVAILLGGLVLLYLWDGLLERVLPTAPPPALPAVADPSPTPWSRRPLAAIALLGLVAGLSVLVPVWAPGLPVPIAIQRAVPTLIPGWFSEPLKPDWPFLSGVSFRQVFHRRYIQRDGEWVELFIGQGNHAGFSRGPFSPKTGHPGRGWILDEEGTARLEPDGAMVDARAMRSGTESRLVYHWYMGTDGFASEALRALLALDSSPYQRTRDALAVRMSTPLSGPPATARARAEARLKRLFHAIRSELGSLGGQVSQWKRFSSFSRPGKSLSIFQRASVNSLSIESMT